MLNYDCFSFLLYILDLRTTDNELDARITDLEDGTGQGKESGFKIFISDVIFLVHVFTGVCQSVLSCLNIRNLFIATTRVNHKFHINQEYHIMFLNTYRDCCLQCYQAFRAANNQGKYF